MGSRLRFVFFGVASVGSSAAADEKFEAKEATGWHGVCIKRD